MFPGELPQRILTVSQLTALLRHSLEERFSEIWIEGEISNLRSPGSGHQYFTLKDEQSQLRAVLFRSAGQRLKFTLREGMQVIVRGRLTVYEARGEYQVALEYVEPKGVGALQLAFEQLKERLAREGLFDPTRKRRLPPFPSSIGVVTSLRGAAIRDIVSVLRRRCPNLNIVIAPVAVQGEGAAVQIAGAIQALNSLERVDVIIVGRGGGSLEDLWCFNEEVVVRAIAESRVPVVSAVGHEIDFTLADFAADHRAATPSVAAETVAPVLQELVERLSQYGDRCTRTMMNQLTLMRVQVEADTGIVLMLRSRLQQEGQRLDDLRVQMIAAGRDTLTLLRRRSVETDHTLIKHNPLRSLREILVVVPQLIKRLEHHVRSSLMLRRQALRSHAGALESLSPLAVLSRGYSIIQKASDGSVLRDAKNVSVGEEIWARLGYGHLICTVRGSSSDS